MEPNRRPYPPGPHQYRRRKVTDYGMQLREKQKARYIYGVLERQFRKHFAEAKQQTGATGEALLQILERRLDNVVYRLGFASSRRQARQLVSQGHIALNGRRTDVPSALVKAGDVVSVREGSRKLEYFQALAQELERRSVPAWLERDVAGMSGKVRSLPERADIDTSLQEQVIVEYYSR